MGKKKIKVWKYRNIKKKKKRFYGSRLLFRKKMLILRKY